MLQRTTTAGDVPAGGGILNREPFRLESLALLLWGTGAAGGLQTVTSNGNWLTVTARVPYRIRANLRRRLETGRESAMRKRARLVRGGQIARTHIAKCPKVER